LVNKIMLSQELRQKFLDFFKDKDHQAIPSSSLVPVETDPTVLFTTAGMQQFKRYYSEPNEAPASRITTCQKCFRTGDIEEVGDDTHLTFFEMLGNFSFGFPNKENSYFKKEAIEFAWQFLTEELGFDKSRIYATYFAGDELEPDTESLEILKTIKGLTEIKPQGRDDNFWSLGTENSPGGPTVEFYIDGVEVWNLVFNQNVFRNGKFESSDGKGVDTGMGFERLLAKVGDFASVYETDLFAPLFELISQISNKNYADNNSEFRVIADHVKSAVMAINDGIIPSNKDAGYVVRRLIRRAVVKANELGVKENFISKIAEKVFSIYAGVYEFNTEQISAELEKEETKFRKTLEAGLRVLKSHQTLDGKTIFDLYQSYGLPLEITLEESKNAGLEINNSAIDQYNNLLKAHQELSRTASAGMFKGGLADSGEETTKLHTAAHLLLASLRKVLGVSVTQKGSNITPERLRFDFSYPEKMTDAQIKEVEDLVNDAIQKDLQVDMREMKLEDAYACGAMGVFGSKYADMIKVYSIENSSTGSEPPFSREICGGPHVTNTAKLGHFKIVKEESSSAGVRRIKAILE